MTDPRPAAAAESKPPRKPMHGGLKFALEFGPLLVFFFVNAKQGILTGTLVFVVATVIALGLSYALVRRVPIMPLVSGVFVLVFGTLTVVLADDLFIKLKPTITNVLFGTILMGGLLAGRNFLKLVLESAFRMDERGWTIMAWRWAFFFYVLAVVNEVVWRTMPTDWWVSFKVFGILPMTIVFSLLQLPLLMKHQLPEDAPQPEEEL